MKALNALFLHGVGQQSADFADDARRILRAHCASRDTALFACSVHWAPLADRVEGAFLDAAERHGSKGNPTQRLVVGTLADALMWQSSADLRAKTFALLDYQVSRFHGRGFTCFAHSLGGLIALQWLAARPQIRGVKLVTMGFNAGLFYLGQKFPVPAQVSAPGSWVNMFSTRDFLGYPAKASGLDHVKDVPVSLGGVFRGWTGLSHVLYWEDASFWKNEVTKVLAL